MSDFQTLALVPTPIAPAQLTRPTSLFMIDIRGDHMEPTYRAGEHKLVMEPVDRFQYDGVYALDIDGEPLAYRCESDFKGGIHVQPDNHAYSGWTVPRAAFAQIVLGICVGELRIRDRRAFQTGPARFAPGQALVGSA